MIVDRSDPEAPQTLAMGLFSASADGIKMQEGSDSFISKGNYRVATLGDKFMAILSGYFSWLGNLLRGDMGYSFYYQKPVGQVISENMWISFFISLVALVLQFAIAIPMGITSATHQYSVRDYTVTVITMIGISLPSFFFAALLITVFSSWLGWFPSGGLVDASSSYVGIAHLLDMLHHLVLPMVVLVVLSIGGLMRYTRTNMLEVLNSDYIRTARSKGLSEKKVIYVHAFRNTMIPLMTLLAGILPSLFGGAMITEQVFGINGIGNLAYKALTNGDIPFIMGYNMFLAVLTVIGTLLSDLMYAVVDPRVKLSK
jgi:peptide/nickel transport system permease protein